MALHPPLSDHPNAHRCTAGHLRFPRTRVRIMAMRWDNLTAPPVEGDPERAAPATPPLPLALPGAVARTFDTPEFAGMTFYEVQAKSILNRVPGQSRVPFEWTINPYRGCSHACVYCFARNTHTYLDLDAGADFDRKVIVKVNAGELVRRELAAPTLAGRARGDGHQRGLLPARRGSLPADAADHRALRDFANPFSILTKGTLILRDLPLLRQAAEVTTVGISFSVGFVDEHALAHRRAGHAAPTPPAGRRPGARRRRLLRRRADGPDPARPQRQRRVDRRHRRRRSPPPVRPA